MWALLAKGAVGAPCSGLTWQQAQWAHLAAVEVLHGRLPEEEVHVISQCEGAHEIGGCAMRQ